MTFGVWTFITGRVTHVAASEGGHAYFFSFYVWIINFLTQYPAKAHWVDFFEVLAVAVEQVGLYVKVFPYADEADAFLRMTFKSAIGDEHVTTKSTLVRIVGRISEIIILLDLVLYFWMIFLYFSIRSSDLVLFKSFVPTWMTWRILPSASVSTRWAKK